MRSFFDLSEPAGDVRHRTAQVPHRRLIQIVTLAFWIPCCIADLRLLRQGGAGAADVVFRLLFHEALVFLALWFVTAATHGLMTGNRDKDEPDVRQRRKLRTRLSASFHGHLAPTRGNRGQ